MTDGPPQGPLSLMLSRIGGKRPGWISGHGHLAKAVEARYLRLTSEDRDDEAAQALVDFERSVMASHDGGQ